MVDLANNSNKVNQTIFSGAGFSYWRRKIISGFFTTLFSSSILIVLFPLLLILGYLFFKGASSINLNFFIHRPAPVGENGGGMGNAIIGSLYVVGLASLIGIPVGLFGGIFLGEFPHNKLSNVIRFVADVLNGTPSIVMGVFAYTVVVLPMKSFSALAGGFALGVMMIPTILRTTDEILQTVPISNSGSIAGARCPILENSPISCSAKCEKRNCHRHPSCRSKNSRRDGPAAFHEFQQCFFQ